MKRLFYLTRDKFTENEKGFGIQKFAFWFWTKIFRKFITNPLFNTLDYFHYIDNKTEGKMMMDEFFETCRATSGILSFIDFLKIFTMKHYNYKYDPLKGLGDYQPYKLPMFMKDIDDDCDGYALFIYWAFKEFLKNPENLSQVKTASELQITIKAHYPAIKTYPKYKVAEMQYNHYIFQVVTSDNQSYIFSSGSIKKQTLMDYMKENFGPEGAYTSHYNESVPKEFRIPQFSCMINEEKFLVRK